MISPRLDEGSEREAFEAEIRKDAGDLSTFGSGVNLHYRNSAVNNAWGGWKARAALAAEPSLRAAVFTVLEGFTLPHDVRKILETAYYRGEGCALMSTPEVQMADAALSTGRLGGEAEQWHAVLSPSRNEGVIFKSKRDAKWTATGVLHTGFGVPVIGDAFRDAYDETSKFVIEKLSAAPAAKPQGDSNV
jgi:hypothetical protein